MAEPKPIASLSSGLLARKGAARPAMRRQGLGLDGMGLGGMVSHPLPEGDVAGQDDLGWNDMGYDVDPAHEERAPDYGNLLAGAIPDAAPAPVVPDVVRQQTEIAERMAEPAVESVAEPDVAAEPDATPAQVLSERKRKTTPPVVTPVDVAVTALPQGRRAAFTLRLDSDRHLRLRLAAAVTGQSAQQLVTAALDELLTKIPEIEDLAGRVPRPAGR